MKLSLGCLTIFLVGAYAGVESPALIPEASWARPITNNLRVIREDGDTPCDKLYTCDGCRAAKVCKPTSTVGRFELVSTVPCPADRPFCDPNTGSCVEQAPPSCGTDDTDFICMRDGRFPSEECTKFHVCINLKPYAFACSATGHRYNPVTQTCEVTDVCGNYECSPSNQGRKSPHSTHDRYFAFCKGEENSPLVIDSCPPQFKLNPQTQECEPNCTVDGIIPDPEDCHSYYKCTKVPLTSEISYMTYDRLKCPSSQAYSQKDFMCVAEEQADSC